MAAPADRVKAIKGESSTGGGSATDRFYKPANRNEDALDIHGVFLQNTTSNDETVYITRTNDHLAFRDPNANGGTEVTLSDLLAVGTITASTVPVTPTGNLASTNVQAALVELQGDIDYLNSGRRVGMQYVADTGGVTSFQAVRSGTNPDSLRPAIASDWTTADVLGFAAGTAAAGGAVDYYDAGVVIPPIKANPAEVWTSGTRIYLSDSVAGAVTKVAPTGAGKVILQVGVAKNNTHMLVQLEDPLLLSI